MKKQFRAFHVGFAVRIYLYHDGEFVERRQTWEGEEAVTEFDKLESEGYTYGYMPEEVEEAKETYEHMLANIIEVKDE